MCCSDGPPKSTVIKVAPPAPSRLSVSTAPPARGLDKKLVDSTSLHNIPAESIPMPPRPGGRSGLAATAPPPPPPSEGTGKQPQTPPTAAPSRAGPLLPTMGKPMPLPGRGGLQPVGREVAAAFPEREELRNTALPDRGGSKGGTAGPPPAEKLVPDRDLGAGDAPSQQGTDRGRGIPPAQQQQIVLERGPSNRPVGVAPPVPPPRPVPEREVCRPDRGTQEHGRSSAFLPTPEKMQGKTSALPLPPMVLPERSGAKPVQSQPGAGLGRVSSRPELTSTRGDLGKGMEMRGMGVAKGSTGLLDDGQSKTLKADKVPKQR